MEEFPVNDLMRRLEQAYAGDPEALSELEDPNSPLSQLAREVNELARTEIDYSKILGPEEAAYLLREREDSQREEAIRIVRENGDIKSEVSLLIEKSRRFRGDEGSHFATTLFLLEAHDRVLEHLFHQPHVTHDDRMKQLLQSIEESSSATLSG